MPVQYQPIPEFQVPDLNLMGAYAQGQALASNRLRDQVLQNSLAEQQRKQELENKMLAVTGAPGFNLSSPEAVRQLQGLDLDTAMKLKASQEEAYYRAQAAEHQRLSAANQASDAAIRAQRYADEHPGLQAKAAHEITQAHSAELDFHNKKIGAAQDILARTAPDGSTYAEDRDAIMQIDSAFGQHLPDKYSPKAINKALMTADMTRSVITKELEARIPKVMAPTENMPGMVVGPGGVEKLPQVAAGSTAWGQEVAAPNVRAPGLGRNLGPAAMELAPEAKAIQDQMATEQVIQQNAPIGREKEALGKYRFSNTLKNIGSTYIDLAKAKGISVPGETPQETFESLANKSRLGTLFGKLNADERLALVDSLRSQVSTAIPQFAAAAGLQSKNFDSNAEGERLRAALADPDNIANISSAFRILNDLNKQFGSGTTLFEPKKEAENIIGARRGAPETPKAGGIIDFGDLK